MKFKFNKLLILLLLLIPINSKAISVTGMSCSPSSVTSGDEFTATITVYADEEGYWEKNDGGMIGTTNLRDGGGENSIITETATSSITFTHSFKALDPGTGTIYFTANLSDFLGDNEREVSASCNITINERVVETPSSNLGASVSNASNQNSNNIVNNSGSSDSSLKSLTTNKGKLSPKFDPEYYDYSLAVSNDIETITIEGEANNSSSEVIGLGEKDLKEGINNFEIIVNAENGESRTYTLTVTRKEKDAIEIIIDKKKYTVIKKEGILTPPKGFIKTNVIIEKQDVIAYSNEYTGYIVVGLIDEKGKASWYIYNSKNSSYIKYNEVNSKELRLVILEASKKDLPANYKKTTIELESGDIIGYYIQGIKDFRLVYAVNMNNGEKGFYQYDTKENTFQRYNDKLIKVYEENDKKLEIALVGAASLILIMFMIILGISSSNRKKKRILKNIKEERIIEKEIKNENNIIEEKKEEVKEEPKEEIKEEKELSKKELKRLEKEKKKELKRMRDEFLK